MRFSDLYAGYGSPGMVAEQPASQPASAGQSQAGGKAAPPAHPHAVTISWLGLLLALILLRLVYEFSD
jgi:hypothetical protein